MDDLIRRADAIELCRKWRDKAHEAKDQDGWWMAANLLSHTKKIPSADAVSEWIPCSERMPEFSTEVLVTMEWGDRHVMSVEWDSQTNELAWEDTIQNFRWDFDNVIAWMPLPKPYEEVKENE